MKRAQNNNVIKKICKITAEIGKWTLGGIMIIGCAATGFVAPSADPVVIQNITSHTLKSGKPIPMVGAWGDGRYIDFSHEPEDGAQHMIRFVANYIGGPHKANVTRIYLSVQKENPADRMQGIQCAPGEICARRDILFLEDHGANGSCDASSEVIAFVERHEGYDIILIYQHVPGKKNRQAKYDTVIHILAGKISNKSLNLP
jgi:hypothetical protein